MSDSAPITRDDVAHVAKLARLALSEAELDQFTEQLGSVLRHADDVASLDLSGVAPTAHPFAITNVVRADVVVASVDRAEVLASAPSVEQNRFRVPKIMGEAP